MITKPEKKINATIPVSRYPPMKIKSKKNYYDNTCVPIPAYDNKIKKKN